MKLDAQTSKPMLILIARALQEDLGLVIGSWSALDALSPRKLGELIASLDPDHAFRLDRRRVVCRTKRKTQP